MALRSWWEKAANATPNKSDHYFSRLSDDKSLLEAEHTARSQEPGDSSSQLTIIEHIELMLKMATRDDI